MFDVYNGRGTAEQWIKEGKNAVKWTRLSCRTFKNNQARLQLFALAYNLANFLRRLALPKEIEHWSLTTLREKLVKTGAKVVRHAKYVTFQLAFESVHNLEEIKRQFNVGEGDSQVEITDEIIGVGKLSKTRYVVDLQKLGGIEVDCRGISEI